MAKLRYDINGHVITGDFIEAQDLHVIINFQKKEKNIVLSQL